MSGKTGRLFKKLVDEKEIAKSSGGGRGRMFGGDGLAVSANQDSRKYAGVFQISAEGISGVKAGQLEQAMEEVVEDLKENPISEKELQKVKNQLRVQKIRAMDIMSGIGILFFLGQNAALGDWTEVNNNPDMCDKVTSADVQRAARQYFANDQRNVMIINTKASAGGKTGESEDPRFTQAVKMIESIKDPAQLEQMMGMLSGRMDQVKDPDQKKAMEKLLKMASERLEALKAKKN